MSDMLLNVVLVVLLAVFVLYQVILLRRRAAEHKSVVMGVIEGVLVVGVVAMLVGGALYLNNTVDEDRPRVLRKISHFVPKKHAAAPAPAAPAMAPAPAKH